MKAEYKSDAENYNELRAELRQLSANRIIEELRFLRLGLHGWAIRAYEDALREKRQPIRKEQK